MSAIRSTKPTIQKPRTLGKPTKAKGWVGVQVVEGVGLVASGEIFFGRLGSVFAEEFGDFGMLCNDGRI